MEVIKERLGKVAITVEKDYWSNTKAYDRLVIVELKGALRTFISRKPVPAGTSIYDREYWIPFSSLQEEFVAQQNAWANGYSSRVEALEELVNNINQQTINYAPAQQILPSIKNTVEYNKFRNVTNTFIDSFDNTTVLRVKCVNCALYMTSFFPIDAYDRISCNTEGFESILYEDRTKSVLFTYEYTEDNKAVNEYVLVVLPFEHTLYNDSKPIATYRLTISANYGYGFLQDYVPDMRLVVDSYTVPSDVPVYIASNYMIMLNELRGNSIVSIEATKIPEQ